MIEVEVISIFVVTAIVVAGVDEATSRMDVSDVSSPGKRKVGNGS